MADNKVNYEVDSNGVWWLLNINGTKERLGTHDEAIAEAVFLIDNYADEDD